MADDEKKIIIDEDWKAQVQREKEQAQKVTEEEGPDAEEQAEAAQEPTSFGALVQSLAAQCMFALGVIAPQGAEQVMVDIGQGKLFIDLLLMLRDKTKGNLTAEEEGLLTESISELQRIYVLRAQQAQEATLKNAGVDLNNPPPSQ